MLDYIKGYVAHTDENYIVVDNGDVGYKIFTSYTTITELSHHGEKVCVFTEMVVKEDSITLCGFSTRNELKMFRLLTSVSGVGTKVGLAILSSIPYMSLYSIITTGDAASLTQANGVGKKTAQRIILELKDKTQRNMNLPVSHGQIIANFEVDTQNFDDAKAALLSLGYSNAEINKAVESINTANASTEDIIKEALKNMMK